MKGHYAIADQFVLDLIIQHDNLYITVSKEISKPIFTHLAKKIYALTSASQQFVQHPFYYEQR
jgi:hypothetical protein